MATTCGIFTHEQMCFEFWIDWVGEGDEDVLTCGWTL